jgi:hypothetical protein
VYVADYIDVFETNLDWFLLVRSLQRTFYRYKPERACRFAMCVFSIQIWFRKNVLPLTDPLLPVQSIPLYATFDVQPNQDTIRINVMFGACEVREVIDKEAKPFFINRYKKSIV